MIVDSPVISCPRTEAHLSQRNAYIMCEVRAQPGVVVLYWVIDHDGTTLVAGQIIREYWTLVIVSHSSRSLLIFFTRSEMTVGQWVIIIAHVGQRQQFLMSNMVHGWSRPLANDKILCT